MKKKTAFSLFLLATAIAAYLLFSFFPELSARYADELLAPLSTAMGHASALIPFPLFEAVILILAVALVLSFVITLWRCAALKSARPLRSFADGVLLSLSLILAGYIFLWTPAARTSVLGDGYAPANIAHSAADIEALCRDLIYQANALNGEVTDAQGRYTLPYNIPSMLAKASHLLKETPIVDARPAPPKLARYPEWMRLFSIAGIYSPWTGETIISDKEYVATLPFTACHEAAHASGIGREEEANFAAYLACMEGDAHFRYSGTLSALLYAMDELKALDRPAWVNLRQEMSPSVQGDFYRMNGFGDADANGWVRFVSRMSDTLLQISGQNGIGSYGEMTSLLLRQRELNG